MASAVLNKAGRIFGVGETVGIYADDNKPFDPVNGPRTAAVASADVDDNGVLSVSGLEPDTNYWAAFDAGSLWVKANIFAVGDDEDGITHGRYGREWYVDAVAGSDSSDGTSWDSAVLTVAQAISLASGGDTIYLIGKTREENVIVPNSKGGLSIVGVGPGHPCHADTPWPYASAAWLPPSSPTADTDLLIIRGQGVRVEGILFDAPVDAAAVRLERNALSGTSEFDASHAVIRNCRFDAGNTGIEDAGGCFNVLVEDCIFRGITDGTGRAIYCSSTAVALPLNWTVRDNRFIDNDNHIIAAASKWFIGPNNVFSDANVTSGIDLTGGGAGNIVWGNALAGTYSQAGGYIPAGAADEWGGNFNSISGGVTAADPA